MLPIKDQLQTKRQRQKVKGWKMTFQANENEKIARVAILISDKTDLKPRR